MTRNNVFGLLFAAFLLAAIVSPVTADAVAPYGGVLVNYTNQSGGSEIQTRVNIPTTVEDVAYPDWLFYILVTAGLVFIIIGIWCVSRSDSVPSLAMIFTGVMAGGSFLVSAYMAPLVATIKTNTDVVVSCTGANSIYVEQTVTYLFSDWVGWACYGGAAAGGIIIVAGALSLFGLLPRRLLGQAERGQYLEMDGEQVDTYHGASGSKKYK